MVHLVQVKKFVNIIPVEFVFLVRIIRIVAPHQRVVVRLIIVVAVIHVVSVRIVAKEGLMTEVMPIVVEANVMKQIVKVIMDHRYIVVLHPDQSVLVKEDLGQ